jgi:hypothetical protein
MQVRRNLRDNPPSVKLQLRYWCAVIHQSCCCLAISPQDGNVLVHGCCSTSHPTPLLSGFGWLKEASPVSNPLVNCWGDHSFGNLGAASSTIQPLIAPDWSSKGQVWYSSPVTPASWLLCDFVTLSLGSWGKGCRKRWRRGNLLNNKPHILRIHASSDDLENVSDYRE